MLMFVRRVFSSCSVSWHFQIKHTTTDNMFKGIYNGKQCHVPDIAAVLTRAWTAGVDRIIVKILHFSLTLSIAFPHN